MGKPHNYPKPDLSRFSNRQIAISSDRNKVELDLAMWLAEVVRNTRNPPTVGVHREIELLGTAHDSIDVMLQATTMATGNGKQTVHAAFTWGRLPDGHWFVRAVDFSLSLSQLQLRQAQQRALKARLYDKAETENAHHVHLRQSVFPAEDHVHSWHDDINNGQDLIDAEIERVHEHAKKDAAAIENPVGAVDMALDMTGLGVGAAKGASEGAERLGSVYEALDKGRTAKGIGDRMRDDKKSTGDKVLETALDVTAYIPGAGPFIRTIAGMMFDIAIASDASRITKIRSRAYIYFVAGYINILTLTDTAIPKTNFDKKYFQLGQRSAPKLRVPGSFWAQIALMNYAASHYTDGGWGGLGYKPETWTFPDQYITRWSPELMGRALATQLHKIEYLVD